MMAPQYCDECRAYLGVLPVSSGFETFTLQMPHMVGCVKAEVQQRLEALDSLEAQVAEQRYGRVDWVEHG